jgi:hypothetical protein
VKHIWRRKVAKHSGAKDPALLQTPSPRDVFARVLSYIFFPVIEINAKFELLSVRNCSYADELSRALEQRKLHSSDASQACRMWRDYAKNTVERRPMQQKKLRKGLFWFETLATPLKSHKTAEVFFWKNLE